MIKARRLQHLQLMSDYGAAGIWDHESNVFDLHIVAAMQANGIGRIYTFNTTDFEAFTELSVVTP